MNLLFIALAIILGLFSLLSYQGFELQWGFVYIKVSVFDPYRMISGPAKIISSGVMLAAVGGVMASPVIIIILILINW
jgi:hypothetical protein